MPEPRAVVFDLKSRDDLCIELSLHERCYLISVLRVMREGTGSDDEHALCGKLIDKLKPENGNG